MDSHQHPYSMPFWEFIESLDPNGPGRGVDHTAPPPPHFPHFGAGHPFGRRGRHSRHGAYPPPGPHGMNPEWAPWFEGSHPPPPPHGMGPEWGAWFDPTEGPWGHHERRRHHGRRHRGDMNEGEPSGEDDWASTSETERDIDDEKRNTPDDMAVDIPDPAEVAPGDDQSPPPHPRFGGRCGRRGGAFGHGGPGGRGGRGGPGGRGGRGGPGGRGGRGGFFGKGHHGPHFGPRGGPGERSGPHRHHHHPPHPAHFGHGFPFDFGGFMKGRANHPLFRNIRDHAQRFQESGAEGDVHTFTPPVDIFDTEKAFVLHVSLPGAKKEDIDVNWDADRSRLNIVGVICRPGDEEFLNTMTSGERKVGTFERDVTLPPDGSERPDEVDGSGIAAKMEDGILIITVPKVEKEWTEIRKVDIE